MRKYPSDSLVETLEQTAAKAVLSAGELVKNRFGGKLNVMQKSEQTGVDLVTDVDKQSQELITSVIRKQFASHMILGEEDPPENEPKATEFIWAVDPIDGTKNFVNESTTYAVSVGVLFEGDPIAGAIWIPWPNRKGFILSHARVGGGAWSNGKNIRIKSLSKSGTNSTPSNIPIAGRLSGIPGNLKSSYKIKTSLKKNLGEVRTTGSTCHELIMVANGTMQYSLSGWANIWDYAAGLIIIREAGGVSLTPDKQGEWKALNGWSNIFSGDRKTSALLRNWKGPVLSASPEITQFISKNLKIKKISRLRKTWKSIVEIGIHR